MSFKNLEQRYTEKVKDLYAGATLKFDNGVPSNGRNDDPLIVRKPGNGYWTSAESRSTPVTSAIQDVKRLTLFTASRRGVSFLLKQQLLQTGNTFESTRLINPVFHIANAVPFLHVKRMTEVPITTGGLVRSLVGDNAITRRIFGSGVPRTDAVSLRRIGQLQQETYNKAVGKKDLIGGVLKKIPVIGQTISATRAIRSVGDYDTVEKRYTFSRPELAQVGRIGQLGQVTATAGRLLGNSLLQIAGNIAALADNQYIVWKQRSDKNKFQNGQTTIFDPKYGATALYGNYDTYLDFSNNKGKWSYRSRSTAHVILGPSPTAVSFGLDLGIQSLNLATTLTGSRELTSAPMTLSPIATKNNLEKKYKSENYWGSSETLQEIINSPEQYIKAGDTVKLLSSDKILDAFKNSSGSAGSVEGEDLSVEGAGRLVLDGNVYLRGTIDRQRIDYTNTKNKWYEQYAGGDGPLPFLKYFRGAGGSITNGGQLDLNNSITTNAKSVAENARIVNNDTKISYISDPSNDEISFEGSPLDDINGYSFINTDFDDSIEVSFAMANDLPIKFRAYVKDLTQTATPEYKSYQYIGRIEKFITYTSVQRQISFKLGLIAYSKDEINGVWRRLNYLTGLVFPYGYVNGIYQPNIVKLTIGNVYTSQPGYLTSLNTNFNQLAETWELDTGKQVPISAEVDVQFMLIEKNAKVASSPFYGITEQMDGFSALSPTALPGDVPVNSETPVVYNSSNRLQSLVRTTPSNTGPEAINTVRFAPPEVGSVSSTNLQSFIQRTPSNRFAPPQLPSQLPLTNR